MDPSPESEEPDAGWSAVAREFVQARLELIRLEARDAGFEAAKRAGLVVFAITCATFFWIFCVAGLIGLVAAARPDWPWYWITLAAAGLHLLAAGVAVLALRKPAPPAFPLTRSELSKDQQWLETLKKKP